MTDRQKELAADGMDSPAARGRQAAAAHRAARELYLLGVTHGGQLARYAPVAGEAVRLAGPGEGNAVDAPMTGWLADNHRRCPDNGYCHHGCTTGCFRVAWASPLSGVFPGDTWPAEITAGNDIQDGVL